MSIKIIDEPEIAVTRGELQRYTADYQQAYAFYSGPLPTLEEYIRARKQREIKHPFGSSS